ncbi:hypothetical protein [Flavobacterium sp. ZS1P14]|uniref:hypothetical protein n=1 Tax=Flavobacterium sp. ZS1P14 TaxID=3401729 RepID=UPI003AB00CB1
MGTILVVIFTLSVGMFGLLIATGVNYYRNKSHGSCETCTIYNGKSVELKSTLSCPNCGYKKAEMMPTDVCAFFFITVKNTKKGVENFDFYSFSLTINS